MNKSREFNAAEHQHVRYNPLKDEWILVSPHRCLRPWSGHSEPPPQEQPPDPNNPLKAGAVRANGQRNPNYTSTYVFPNDFPALLERGPEPPQSDHPLFQARQARGTCRVMCFHPNSAVSIPLMSVEEILSVVEEWVNQTKELGRRYTWVQIFENKGNVMGCSNPHPHCQIWASSFLPNEGRIKDRCQKEYYTKYNKTLLVEYLEMEMEKKERIVIQNTEWVALVPYWATWPFETMVLPINGGPQRLTDLNDQQKKGLAEIIKLLTTKYDNLFSCSFPYSMGFHGAPTGPDHTAGDSPHWLLHAIYLPPLLRSATVKKFMVPDGLSIQVCWECLAAVRAVGRFQAQILKSYEVLINYSRKHTFLNSPADFTAHATTRLTMNTIELQSNDQPSTPAPADEYMMDIDLKIEDNKESHYESDNSASKKDDYVGGSHFSEDLSQEQYATSDDDVQLSKLKTEKTKKKEKREKKGKKEKSKTELAPKPPEPKPNNRRLKNLPEGLVELYTMTEEEMWQIRAEDVASKVFTKLKYRCDMCLIGFNTEKLMNDHMNGKHRPKGDNCHQCDVCQAYFLTKENVSAHRALHATAFRCRRCGVRTSLKRLVQRHAAAHAAQQHQCASCGALFSTKSKLTYHRSICRRERPQCDCCGKVFANKMTLKYHLKLLPQNKEDKPKEKLYIPCKGCDKVFHSKKSYRSHVVIHEGVSYPCPTCGKLFQWKRNLARHARNHREREQGATHECRPCNKSFASRDCYNNHMRLSKRHVAEDTYVHECSYCGKKFPTKWCMVDHIDWDHLKRIKYQCRVCFKAFKTAKIMVAHMNNIHEGKRNKEPDGEHLCEICGKSYKTVKRLKGHVWAMHTNRSTTKSFKCKLCPATFTWQTSIYKHVKIMHENKRGKLHQPRAQPIPKKEETYPGIDLANRMHYFQQSVSNTIAPVHPVAIIQNVV